MINSCLVCSSAERKTSEGHFFEQRHYKSSGLKNALSSTNLFERRERARNDKYKRKKKEKRKKKKVVQREEMVFGSFALLASFRIINFLSYQKTGFGFSKVGWYYSEAGLRVVDRGIDLATLSEFTLHCLYY